MRLRVTVVTELDSPERVAPAAGERDEGAVDHARRSTASAKFDRPAGASDRGSRLLDHTREARAAGADHDSPFGAGRNIRSVWTIATEPFPEAHFATFPRRLVEPCVKAGCPVGGLVLDPFAGSGTTGVVALSLSRSFVGIELNPEYAEMARRRIGDVAPLIAKEATA